ncbi:hypothetical protein RND71_003194 [Anisodus tanguticus]|uniref:NB-ARC domain-containing protein n=1 Tax=Anisodus tanguticus TaxID=243964 RepID=A0AAE1VNH5_9SOLA|nr:hypothetical protein RND71_003194 [Anisodus tanguticus]
MGQCFRDAQSRNRITLTTRLSDIANYVKSDCGSNPHHLHLFRDDESWTLLQEEVFQRESCPPELIDVRYRIEKGCGWLPLFIVLVAGVLKNKKKKVDLWEEGKDIRVSKLARSWLVEGFVQANKERREEDVAQVLLEDLISRNLVMVMEKRLNDKIEFLSRLESLKLVCNSYPAKLPHEFNFPSKLRELTLSKFRLPWSEISIIGELPNLEIIRLLSRDFEGINGK